MPTITSSNGQGDQPLAEAAQVHLAVTILIDFSIDVDSNCGSSSLSPQAGLNSRPFLPPLNVADFQNYHAPGALHDLVPCRIERPEIEAFMELAWES